jgi:hypothetical protein
MILTKGTKVKVCIPSKMGNELKIAEVIVLTKELGKQIGVKFDEVVNGGHTCDGKGPEGFCLWASKDHIYPLEFEWPTPVIETLEEIESLEI